METYKNIKIGDVVKVKSKEWFEDNKEKLTFDFEDYEPYFDQEFVVTGIEQTVGLTYPTKLLYQMFNLRGTSCKKCIGRNMPFIGEMLEPVGSLWNRLSKEAKIAAKTLYEEWKDIEPDNDDELFGRYHFERCLGKINLQSNRSLRPSGTGNFDNK